MRPPVETPSMKSPRLRVANVPVNAADTRRISSLSRGRVPFMGLSSVAVLGSRFQREVLVFVCRLPDLSKHAMRKVALL